MSSRRGSKGRVGASPLRNLLNGGWLNAKIYTIFNYIYIFTSKCVITVTCTSWHNSYEYLSIYTNLFIELTLGTLSLSQTPSAKSLSLISQANIVGFCRLYSAIFETTFGVATLGLLPPITPGLMEPVS